MIERIGEQSDSFLDETYVIKKGKGDEEFFHLEGFGMVTKEIPIHIEARIIDSRDPAAPTDPIVTSLAQALREQLRPLEKQTDYPILAQWKSGVQDLIAKSDAVIAEDKNYIALTPQVQCPYEIKKDSKVKKFMSDLTSLDPNTGKPTLREVYIKVDGKLKPIGRL